MPTANLYMTPCNPFSHYTRKNMHFYGSAVTNWKELAVNCVTNQCFIAPNHACFLFFHEMSSNLSSLCTPSLESRQRCSRHPESRQAFGQTVGASTGQRECAVHTTILITWRHQTFLAISAAITLFLPLVFSVAAPLPPQNRALLAAQMVQGGCPFGRACNINKLL